jgi:5-methylcytosine-specific restriction protein A
MKEIYAELAQHVIHVHHTKPVGSLPENYRIDPIRELVPVCPNCHAVIHAKRKPLSIKKLRSLLSNRRK